MKDLQESKKIYEQTEIPAELSQIVNDSIRKMDEKRRKDREDTKASIHSFEQGRKRGNRKILKRSLTTAAAFLICFTLGLNSNQAFAGQMGDLPIIGVLARVLTVRSYEESNAETGINVAVEVPAVEAELISAKPSSDSENADFASTEEKTEAEEVQARQPSLAVDVNGEIEKVVEEHLAKAETDFAEYKKAFFETGGTEEEWAGRTMDVQVDYEIKFQDGERVSFVLYLTEAWVASYQQEYYYNLNLAENREITLEELLGPDYVKIANESIIGQMDERMAENEDYVYWGREQDDDGIDMGGFTTVDENTTFYINEAGNPVITFAKYEVAPGFMGVQEFEIER